MVKVVFRCTREYLNIIDADRRESAAISQEVVHNALEGARGVANTKRHYAKLKTSKFCLKCGALHMLMFEANLMVTLLQINFGKVRGTCHVVDQVINTRKWIRVILGDVVEGALINAQL